MSYGDRRSSKLWRYEWVTGGFLPVTINQSCGLGLKLTGSSPRGKTRIRFRSHRRAGSGSDPQEKFYLRIELSILLSKMTLFCKCWSNVFSKSKLLQCILFLFWERVKKLLSKKLCFFFQFNFDQVDTEGIKTSFQDILLDIYNRLLTMHCRKSLYKTTLTRPLR